MHVQNTRNLFLEVNNGLNNIWINALAKYLLLADNEKKI